MIRTPIRSVALAAAALLTLTACGGSESESGSGETTAETSSAASSTTESSADTGSPSESSSSPAEADGEPITVGIVTSTSGLLGGFGQQFVDGLEAGLDFATGGTGAVGGRPVELEIIDDGGEPEKAISAATDLVGRGVTILAGTVSSGIAIQLAPFAEENDILYISGPAASDAITGQNANTFRSGRQTYQDVATAATLVPDLEGASVMVFAQDSEFGAGNVAAVEAVLGEKGATVDSLLVPLNATEFTPFASQVIDAAPDLLFVAWAGDTAPAMWQALEQQGVPEQVTVTTGLADRAVWPVYAQGTEFLAHYFAEAADNDANAALVEAVGEPDLFTPDGFVAAQMIVHAIEAGSDDVSAMISALEDWTFDAPKGSQTIRASDHAMLQPMFTASLEGDGDTLTATLLDTLPAEDTAPPEAS